MMMMRTDRVDVINDERQRSCSGARSNPAHRESFKLDLTDEEWASDWVRERKESGSGGLSSRRGSGEAASPDSLNLEQRLAFDLLQSWFDSWSRIQFDGSNEPACEPALALVYGVGGTGKSAALRCFQSYVAPRWTGITSTPAHTPSRCNDDDGSAKQSRAATATATIDGGR